MICGETSAEQKASKQLQWLDLPKKASSTEEPKNRNILAILGNVAVADFEIVNIVQRHGSNLKVPEDDILDLDLTVIISMNSCDLRRRSQKMMFLWLIVAWK